jgi:hypothetical protein
MRVTAKAESAGSSAGPASRLARILCGALAPRGHSARAAGSGARSSGHRSRSSLLILSLTALALLAPASAVAFTEYGYIGQFGETGSGPGQFGTTSFLPQRLAVGESTGYSYVTDPANNRIDVFKPAAASGACGSACATPFIEFGSGILTRPEEIALDQSSGALYTTSLPIPAVDEQQQVTVEAEGGTFKLGFEGEETGATATGNVEEESEKVKNVHITSGTLVLGEFISGAGIPAETEIIEIKEVEAGKFTLTLSQEATATATGVALSADLAYIAGHSEVEGALEALPAIGAGNVSAAGSFGGPWTVTFEGKFAGTDVEEELSCDGTGLEGAAPECTVETTKGGAASVPGKLFKFNPDNAAAPTSYTQASGAEFTSPEEGSGATQVGSFGTIQYLSLGGVAVDPTSGDVLIADPANKRIDRVGSNGAFKSSFDGTGGGGTAFVEPVDVAVNSQGEAIVADMTPLPSATLTRYNGAGEHEATLSPSPENYTGPAGFGNTGGIGPTVLAVNPATDEVFASSQGFFASAKVYEYKEDVKVAEYVTPEASLLNPVYGLAVRGTAPGRLYATATKTLTTPRVQVWEATALGEFPLTVTKTGTGSGTVQCDTGSGPEPCAAEYPKGTEVTLTANANAGSEFTEWSGDCSGSGSCELTMDAAHSVTAGFDLEPTPEFPLTITKTGTGTGTVKCDTGSGPGPCAAEYPEGTEVTLTVTPGAGSEFTGFSGDCSGATCELTMNAAHSVTAGFDLEAAVEEFELTVTTAGTGSGSVSCDSGSGPGACASSYPEGTTITLAAIPGAHSGFAGWSGGGCSGAGGCVIAEIGADTTVTATFNLIQRSLTVSKLGSGAGSVSSSPAGIACGADCSETYSDATVVTLTASADAGSAFSGWSGACSGAGACEVTMSADKAVSARFDSVPSPPPPAAQCEDGIDNDANGLIDYPVDPGCTSSADESEAGAVLSPPSPSGKQHLKCKKGFHKKRVHGKTRCVKAKKHAAHGHRRHRLAATADRTRRVF